MKVSEHFDIREFVSKATWERNGVDSIKLIDKRLIDLAEFYRKYFGSAVTINNWHTGGNFQNRGFRDFDSNVGGKTSMHRTGQAFDCNIKGYTIADLHKAISKDQNSFYNAGLRRIEDIKDAPTWLHSDLKDVGLFGKIYIFKI